MDQRDYYQEKKWCEGCNEYVRYLMSVNDSYCIRCGTQVQLFSGKDASASPPISRSGSGRLRSHRDSLR